ncbi:MAG: 3'-5' exoribonuclease [Bacteroidales bacterium]|nr:3'-5' exoribonuclease [Bacteroidales bacterium]
MSFIALDLETATLERRTICEIGLAFVKDSQVIDTKSWLVRPEHNEYDWFNISIHGITPEMTKHSPSFKQVWKEVGPLLENQIVVAHNTGFDMYALRDAFDYDDMPYPHFQYYCSYRAARYTVPDAYSYSLPLICRHLGIPFDKHHRAGVDAEGCARVFLEALHRGGVSSLEEFQNKYEFKCGEFGDNLFRPQLSIRKYSTKPSKEYVGDPSKFDEGSYFYGKAVCFTGKCEYGTRDQLLQKIADIGGTPVKGVTKDTNILVVGQQDYRVVGEAGLSSKQQKAIALKDSGVDIEIMSEAEFLNMI